MKKLNGSALCQISSSPEISLTGFLNMQVVVFYMSPSIAYTFNNTTKMWHDFLLNTHYLNYVEMKSCRLCLAGGEVSVARTNSSKTNGVTGCSGSNDREISNADQLTYAPELFGRVETWLNDERNQVRGGRHINLAH